MVKFNHLASEESTEEIIHHKEERRVALLLGALMLALYLRTLAPGLLAGDPGEFQVAAWTLGIAHPTGYPLYLILGYLWQHGLALVGISPAVALNGFSAVCGAIAVGLSFLVQIRWLPGSRPVRIAAAAIAAIFFGLNPTFWNQSLVAEVYSLHMLLVLLIVLAAQRYIEGYAQAGRATSPFWLYSLCGFVGLSLTHHVMILWLLPGLVLTLLWLWLTPPNTGGEVDEDEDENEGGSPIAGGLPWLSLIVGLVIAIVPLLLYLYIPLRSGPGESPWYHQPLGERTLTLYENSWSGFLRFFTGQSISVGFRSFGDALGQLGFALEQWQIHFTWLGLLLMLFGLYALVVKRCWPLLLLTLPYFFLQQGFNLVYAIGDIFVYYIPLFWIGTVWVGFGVATIGSWLTHQIEQIRQQQGVEAKVNVQPPPEPVEGEGGFDRLSQQGSTRLQAKSNVSALLILLTLVIPFRIARTYFPAIDQSGNIGTRLRWEEIMAAEPPANAILVSNDRNEIVPLFYLQHVEGRGLGMTGLFPLIAPDERFADIGATISTALREGTERPIMLIKPMEGLETRFRLADARPPVFEVKAEWGETPSQFSFALPYGPLTFMGYDWQPNPQNAEEILVNLAWKANGAIDGNYTTSVQLYDASGERIAQDDRTPGGLYYPTSLWEPGEILRDAHQIRLAVDATPETLLIVLYKGENFEPLAPPLEVPLKNN